MKSAAIGRWLAALLAALLVAACGGGGDGDGPATPGNTIQGNWQLALSVGGQSSAAVAVQASAVPSADAVANITTANVAQLFSSGAFQGFTVTVSGTTVTVTGPGTNYQLVINSIGASNYQGCGGCGPGSRVSFDVDMNYTESGTFDGTPVPPNTDSLSLSFGYTRLS
jgi:hypothetical protein